MPPWHREVGHRGSDSWTGKKWGSAAVRIPALVLAAARVHLDQTVDVREEGGRIVIEPLRPTRYDIDNLVAGITDENRHYRFPARSPHATTKLPGISSWASIWQPLPPSSIDETP